MVDIRLESPADIARIHEVEAAAFGQPAEARLVDVLREDARPVLSLVAEQGGVVVGHVFFSPVSLEGAGAPSVAGLGPIGVDPAQQGRGIGSALVREGLARCPALGWQAVFLVGNPAYYSRFGFVLAAPLGFHYPNPVHDPVLQVAELEPGVLEGYRGLTHFHSAFDEAEG